MPKPSARPITLSDNRGWRFATLCALYFAQGVPYGFVTIALVAMMTERGATPEQTGSLAALSLLPWTFKIIWGPIIDSLRLPSLGRRRPWIIFAEFMMAMTMLVVVSTTDLTSTATVAALGAVFFIHNCFAALQDVATDALAVDLLDDKERGRVNAFMWASKLLGYSAGGAGLSSLIAKTDLATAMRVQAGLLLLIMLLPLLLRERADERLFPWSADPHAHRRVPQPKTGPIRVATQLVRAFGLRATFLGLFVAFGALIGEGLAIPVNAEVFIRRIGWSAEHYSHVRGTLGSIGQILGAIGGGLLCDRFGPKLIAGCGTVVTGSTFLTLALTSVWWRHEWFPVSGYFLMLECGLAMTSVSLFSLYMKISWTTAAATQFTLYMTVLNLGHAFGPMLTRLGLEPRGTLMLCAAVSLLPLLFLPFIDPQSVARLKREAGGLDATPGDVEIGPDLPGVPIVGEPHARG